MSRMGGPRVGPVSLGGHSSPSADILPDITAVNWSATPRSSDERDLIEVMRHDPSNLNHRRIYAGFLYNQDSGADDAKAALIRYMCGEEQYRDLYVPSRYTGIGDGYHIYRSIVRGEGDGQLVPPGRLMLSRGLIAEAFISSTREIDIPGTWLVASALSAHPVERLVLEHTTEQVARLLEQGRVMDGVRSLVLNGADGGARLGALASRLTNVSCSLADAGEICRYPTNPVDRPSTLTRVLPAVTIVKDANARPTPGSWRLLGRDVTLRFGEVVYSSDEIARFVEPEITTSLTIEGRVTPGLVHEIARLAPHLERLSFVGYPISDDSWRELLSYQFPKLKELQIQGAEVPDEAIARLPITVSLRT